MRLLLDEMISPRIARALRDSDHDVQAIKGDRPDLESLADLELVRRMSAERRAIVTNNVKDFHPIHQRLIARGETHHGMAFTGDAAMPRSKAQIPLWVRALDSFLASHPDEDSLRNRIHHLP